MYVGAQLITEKFHDSSKVGLLIRESRADAGKSRAATVNLDLYTVCTIQAVVCFFGRPTSSGS